MKFILAPLVLAALALALPQAPPAAAAPPSAPAATEPAGSTTTGSGPKPASQAAPKSVNGLSGWSDVAGFGGLAMDLGIDAAKATPDPSGLKCQTLPIGKFCFGPNGGSFTLQTSGGGTIVGGVGSADDVYQGDYLRKLRARDLGDESAKVAAGDEVDVAAELEGSPSRIVT